MKSFYKVLVSLEVIVVFILAVLLNLDAAEQKLR